MKNFKKLLSIGLIFSLAACSGKANSASKKDKLNIVTTIYPQYNIAKEIAKDKANVKMLLKPGQEMHSYEPSPKDIKEIQDADIFIYNGGHSDAWVDEMLKSLDTKKTKVVKLMDSVEVLKEEVEGMEHKHSHEEKHNHDKEYKHEEKHDHDKNHKHEEKHHHNHKDEHIWTSPKNGIKMTEFIEKTIKEANPENKDYYEKNAHELKGKLNELDYALKNMIKSKKRNFIVVADRFPFRYLCEDYKIEYRAAFTGCSTEAEASSGTVKYLVDFVKENKIPAVYRLELSKGLIAKTIADESGAKVVELHSMHNVSSEDFEKNISYVDLMKKNIAALKEGLN